MKTALSILTILLFISCSSETGKQNLSQKSKSIRVIDTYFSKGRLGLEHQIKLKDIENFHGHLCDGLVVGFIGLNEGLIKLYPDSIIDRTNTRIISNSSPCLTDVAIYLTGGRSQYNTFYVSNEIEGIYIVQRIDNGKTIEVKLNEGVKPKEITLLGFQADNGELSSCQLLDLKEMEDRFSVKLLESIPAEIFTISEISDFAWEPILSNEFIKTDIINKNKEKCELN